MQLRTLGASTVHVSPIGLGLAALGRPGYINLGHAEDLDGNYEVAAMEAHTHRVLDAAWQGGVRYFDAARSYGRAEQFLSTWLRQRAIDPASVAVGSKWGYTYTADWQVQAEQHEVKDHSLPVLQRQWQESQQHLQRYLRLYQIHSATLDSGVLTNQAVLTELAHLKEQGVLIGFSVSGANQATTIRRALELHSDGKLLFNCVQATWNVLETSAGPALQEAHAAGLGVIIKEVLANGRLTRRSTFPKDVRNRALLERKAMRLGASVESMVLRAVLEQPWVDIALTGAATVEQVQASLQAVEIPWYNGLDAELAVLSETPKVYWETRKTLAWN